jgi:hypothetical protein
MEADTHVKVVAADSVALQDLQLRGPTESLIACLSLLARNT